MIVTTHLIRFDAMKMRCLCVVMLGLWLGLAGSTSALAGCISGDCQNGEGVAVLKNGVRYEGGFKDGKSHGQGTIIFPNGDRYTGMMADGRINGKGTYRYANGNKYVGSFKNGRMEGNGVYTYANGNRYVGHFKNNLMHGWGTFYHADGTQQTGYFKEGKLEQPVDLPPTPSMKTLSALPDSYPFTGLN